MHGVLPSPAPCLQLGSGSRIRKQHQVDDTGWQSCLDVQRLYTTVGVGQAWEYTSKTTPCGKAQGKSLVFASNEAVSVCR